VGHEIDFTIADLVADLRAATPSNAAELVVDRADNFRARIDRAVHRLASVMRHNLARRSQGASRLQVAVERWPLAVVMHGREGQQLALRLPHAVMRRVARQQQRLAALRHRLARRDARQVAASLRARVIDAEHRLVRLAIARRHRASERTGALAAELQALSPLAVLGRGYAVCWNASRTSIIRSSRAVEPGDVVQITLADGSLGCRVEDRRKD
jgi:exodeoxyribonuclease VII large subunit